MVRVLETGPAMKNSFTAFTSFEIDMTEFDGSILK